MGTTKIIDIVSDGEESDNENKVSDESIVVYPRILLDEIGKSAMATDPPENFEKIVEKHRVSDVSAIIFPSVSKDVMEPAEEIEEESASEAIDYLKHMDGPIEDQMMSFQEFVKMTGKTLDKMKEVSDALENVLKTEFPDCKAFPYGSSASGLGAEGCDLDIYVELGYNAKDETFHEISNIKGGKFRTRRVCEILRRVERFKSALAVSNARTPIIQLRERVTRIKCDINVVSSMGVKNTQFLAFCTVQDNRFRILVSILKYFCSQQGIVSSGKGDHMNSYTLVLMVLFFLQRRGILYPLEVLQNGIEREEIEGWNFAFCRDLSKLPQLRPNPSSKFKLLSDFFEFYVNFRYDHVICPLTGQYVKKYNMAQGIYLPKVLEGAPFFGRKGEKLELNKALVVQDPFELTRNVGHAVSRKRQEHMVEQFKTASKIMKDLKRKKSDVKFWMLFEPNMTSYKNILISEYKMFPKDMVNEEDRFTVDNFTEEVVDGGVLQDLTDDEKIQEKERRLESEEHELNVVGEIRNTESSITIKPNLNILEQSKINPTIMEIKQFLFHQQRLRFPAPKLS